MKWNVFRINLTRDEVEVFDIFNHTRFKNDVEEALRNSKTKEEFSEPLRKELMYYYWSKFEYEMVISPLINRTGSCSTKVDIYTQVMNNFDVFLDYIWSFKEKK